ncbi:putative Zinc finger MYM-type protein, partial [Daphnia magna]
QTDQKNINQFKVLRDWILYSPATGKIFCFPCIIFSLPSSTTFGDPCVGFKDWKHGDFSLRKHKDSKSHKTNATTLALRRRLFGKIDQHIEEVRSTEGSDWKSLLLRVVAIIKFLCETGLPLRGDNELIGSTKNGHFLCILELMSQFDPFICNHLKEYGNKGKSRSSYLSSTIYEELITIMGVKVLSLIISDIQEARFFSVSIDSTPDLTHVDQLSMIMRYFSVKSHEATERFLSFIPTESHTGEYLANIIFKFFEDQKIDIKNARGQSYDNAANMSG